MLRSATRAHVQPSLTASSGSGNYKPGTYVYQALRTISAEEIKKIIKLMEAVSDRYLSIPDSDETVEPQILRETFPPCEEAQRLNVADVLVTCNFLFRDA